MSAANVRQCDRGDEHEPHKWGDYHCLGVVRWSTKCSAEPLQSVQSAASTDLWVDVTLRLPRDEFVHPEIVRDDLLDVLPFEVAQARVTDTSPGYMELAS